MNIGFRKNIMTEFQSDRTKVSDQDIIDCIVAFANTDGGNLCLGVESDGEITGLHNDHMDNTQLAAFIANHTIPPIAVRTEVLELEYPVLKIEVPEKREIVSSSEGKVLRRRLQADGTPEMIPMYPCEFATRLSSFHLFDYTAQPVPNCSYEDLDPVERERLRNVIRAYRGEAALLELGDEELDKALRLVTEQNGTFVPTFCGLLLIGKKESLMRCLPAAESAVQVLTGTDLKINESFYLPILAAFEKITKYFHAWTKSEEMDLDLYRITIPDFDILAFWEALVNAYSHRDYASLGRVRVQIDEEGLTITNPGGFIEGIHIDNLIEADPHGRNPLLADTLKRIGLAERTRRGIDRIYEGSLLYGKPLPDYSRSTTRTVSLYIPNGPADRAFLTMLSEERKRTGRDLPIYALLVMNTLRKLRKASAKEIAADIPMKEMRVEATLEALTKSGLTEVSEKDCIRYYMLESGYYRKKG